MYQKEHLYPYIKDPFAVACLAVDVNWNGYEFIIGIVYLLLVIFAFLIFKSESLKKAFVIICCSTALCMLFYTAIVVPKIEGHSQRSAVNFYKQLSGQDVYIITVGFKSYAHYFYARRPAGQRPERNDLQWLLLGKIDKPAYFVIKIQDKEKMDQYKSLQWLDTKGGFVFYRREPD